MKLTATLPKTIVVRAFLAFLPIALSLGTVSAQTNALDWDTNTWDYVGEIGGTGDDTISHTFNDVDGSGVDVTLQFDPLRGNVDTRSTDGTFPDRDTLDEMLNADAAHTGIFNLFIYNSDATLNYGFSESDRDDAILSTFTFSGPVLDVTFDAIDVDKSNFVGAPLSETSGRGDGWIDQLTITGFLNGQPVYPVFGTIPSGSNTPANSYYAIHSAPNPSDYILVTGANNNVLEGRWEFSEKGNFGTQPDDGGLWDTGGTYGADIANVEVSFPTAIDSFTIQYENGWSVPGNTTRTTPDEYWGGHSQETGISDIGFTPYICSLDFDDGAGGAAGYVVGDNVFITAEDVIFNTDSGAADSMTVTLTNDRTGETEVVSLLETGNDTGIFSIAAGFPTTDTGSTANNDGTLNVQYGDTVTVTSLTGGTGDQCLDTYRFPVPTDIVKAVDKTNASEGENLTYTIDVNYPAGDVLTDVTVTDAAPTGTTMVAASATAGGVIAGQGVTWDLGSTVAGATSYQAPGLGTFPALDDATNDFGGQDSLDPSVAMDAAGKLHVAFVGKATGASKLNIYYTNNVGGAWSTPLLLSNDTDAQDALAPSIAVDAGGNVHVVYTDDTGDAKRNAYYVKASAAGGVLAGPTRLSSDVNNVLTSDVAVDGNGHIHVVFGDKTATDAGFNAYYRVSTNGGTSFSAQESVSDDADGQDALVPAIAVSASGTAHIVYTDDTGDAVRNVYHVAGTVGSFSVPLRLSDDTDGQAATAPAVAVDGSGHAHVVYGDKQAGDAKRNIYYTNNVGGSFTAPVDATADFSGQDSSLPAVGVDVQGAAHLSFQNVGSDGGKIDIFYTNNQSGSFATPTQFTTNLDGQDSLNTDIAVGVNSVCVVFGARDPSDSKRNVYNTCADILVGTSMSVSATPAIGTTGDTVTVTAVLTATEDLTGVLPVLTPAGTNNMGVSLDAAPSAQNLTSDTPAQFVWTYTITEGASATPGQLTFQVAATNNDATFGLVDFGTADSNSLIATPPLEFQVTVDVGATSPISNTASVEDAGEKIVTGNPKCYAVADGISGTDNDRLVFVENVSGTPVFNDIGSTGTTHIEAMALSPDESTLYVTERDSGIGAGSDSFGTLDLSTGAFTAIGRVTSAANPLEGALGNFTVADIDGLSFDPVSGDLYAISRRESSATHLDLLLKIDPATGLHIEDAFGAGVDYLAVNTAPLGLYDIDDISFNPVTGVLYAVANSPSSGGGDLDRLVTINTATGAVTDIGRITNSAGGNLDDVEGLSFDGDGMLHATTGNTVGGSNDDSMWMIDPATAVATLVLAFPLYEDYEAVACLAAPYVNGDRFIPPTASNQVQTIIGGNTIGNYVWIDSDGDGEQDGGETGLNGVTVNLLTSAGAPTGYTTTTANNGSNDGAYEFTGIPDGSYIVEFIAPGAYDITSQDSVADTIDSDADPVSGRTDAFTVGPNETNLTFDAGMYEPVTISGSVQYNNGGGNQPLGGVVVRLLDGNGDPVLDGASQPITTTTSGIDGSYSFTGIPPGTYRIVQDQPSGYGSTSDTDGSNNNVIGDETPIVLASGQSSLGNDFLEVQLANISGAVLADTDNDGGGNVGIETVTLTLWSDPNGDGDPADGAPIDDPNQVGVQNYQVTTNSSGVYNFTNVPAGDYVVVETQPASYNTVTDGDTTTPGDDAANASTLDDRIPVTVVAGETDDGNNFVEELPASLGDLVWLDLNGNGIQDGGSEAGMDGILVRLLDADNGNALVTSVITSGGGAYLFEDLTPGNYIIEFIGPDGYAFTLQDQVGTEATDSDVDASGRTDVIAVVRGTERTDVDAGMMLDPGKGAIGNYIWLDENGDGVQDAGEAGIPGVTVELLDSGNNVIDTVTTDANGGYLFSGLDSGNYTVRINGGNAPTGTDLTSDPDSTADNLHAVSLAAGEEYLTADFGYNWVDVTSTDTPSLLATGAIGDRVWSDADGDGKQDPGESGISGLLVTLYSDPDGDGIYDNVVTTTTTNASGSYIFDDLAPDAYVVKLDGTAAPLTGATQTGDPDGVLDDATTMPIVLAPGDVYLNADFGYQFTGTANIGDQVYFDANASGTFDGSDSGIAGVTVALIDLTSGQVAATTTTDGTGTYLFPGLPTGVGYRVEIVDSENVLGDLVPSGDPDGGNDGQSTIANLAATDLDQDFGYTPEGHTNGDGLIGDTVFIDRDGDGVFDPGEGRERVRVELWNFDKSQLLAATTTDENGNYYFGGLGQFSSYHVEVDTSGSLAGLTNIVDPDTANPGDSTSFINLAFDADGIKLDQDFGYEGGTNSIEGVVWLDPNADGTRDAGEITRFSGITVVLLDPAGNIIGTATTDGTGGYRFDNLPDGSYTVDVTDRDEELDGYWHSLGADSAPDPSTVTVNSGNPSETIDFGYYVDPAVIGNFVWNDLNGDGVQDGGEPGIGGVRVTLKIDYPNGDSITVTTLTDSSGAYRFAGLLDEDYASSGSTGGGLPIFTVTAEAPAGYAASPSNVGGDDTVDSDDSFGGEESIVAQGGLDDTNDFGFYEGASIGNYVWLDENSDGVQDEGERGLSGIVVELLDGTGSPVLSGGNPVTAVTDSNGGYIFTGLAPGDYQVRLDSASVPTELDEITFDPQGAVDGVAAVTVASGDEIMTLDFGLNYSSLTEVNNPPLDTVGAIGDRVWNDADGDGVQDPGESGIGGVTVILYTDPDGDGVYDNPADSRITSPDGTYVFAGLLPGSYVVQVTTPPAGTTQTGDPEGNTDNRTTTPIVLAPGDVYLLADFGYDLNGGGAGIGDTVYLDVNGDGGLDSGEPGIPGVTVALLDANDKVIATTTTDASGNYLFPGLPTGADYTVLITDTNHVLGELAQTGDPDGGNDGTSLVSSLSADDLNQDFGYAPRGHSAGQGLIGDTIFLDLDGDGIADAGEGIEGVKVTLKDSAGNIVSTTTTDENGNYSFGSLDPVATYTVEVDPASLPAGVTNTVDPDTVGAGDNTSSVDLSLTSGVNLDQDFGYEGTNSINGVVWEDTDAEGDLDETGTGIGGVTVSLLDPDGNVIATTTTLPDGSYIFSNVPDGTFTVDVTDVDGVLSGYSHSLGVDSDPDPTAVTVNSGNPTATADFGYYKDPAALGNFVWYDQDGDGIQDSGEPGIENAVVTLTITYPNGNVITVVDVTDATGHYDFGNLLADESFNGDGIGSEPTYQLTVATPTNFEPTQTGQGTALTDSENPAGTSAQPVQGSLNTLAASTEPIAGYDFGFTSAKQNTFASWQTDNPLGGNNGATDNPDGDIYNNALEYAFCLKPEDGTPTTVPGGPGGFCALLNNTSGEVDAFYVRAEGPTDVTFTLQSSTTLGDPVSWTDRTDLTPAVTTNGNGTETVTYTDLETEVGSSGIVRLKVEIAGDATGPHYTQVWGWNAETLPVGCQTCSYPYAPKGIYGGTAVSGNYSAGVLTSTAGGDVSALVGGGAEYYIEFIGGIYEGHRFDLNEGAATATGIAIDTANARNTLAPVPTDLQGAYEIRAHHTLDSILPPDTFTPHNNSGLGDRLLLYANGGWQVVWSYDQSGGIPAQWTDAGNSTLDDVGNIIVDACQGLYTHPRLAAVDIVSVGVVRDWDFACPLNAGYNLIGGGYPEDQSPHDRAMLRDASDGVAQDYFTSDPNPILADQLLHWLGDDVVGVEGYRTYYDLYLPSTTYDYWTDQTNSNLTNENGTDLFLNQRATFYDMISGHDRSTPAEVWVWPARWTP